MIIKSLDECRVYQKALEGADAISAILRRECFGKDFELRNQLARSSGRVPAHISEGFRQQTDRHLAHYLHIANGSASETVTHLRVACGRGYISAEELKQQAGRYDSIGRMLTVWLQHLRQDNRKDRGSQ